MRYSELVNRLDGLRRVKGADATLTVGYETTAVREGEAIALAYRGTRFALLTPNSITVWHNHQWLSQTFQRQINKVLKPAERVAVIRDGQAYLLDATTKRLTPFPTHTTITLTPREGHTS